MAQLNTDPANLLASVNVVTHAYLEHFARTAMTNLQAPQLAQLVAEALGTVTAPAPASATAPPPRSRPAELASCTT